MSSADFVRRLDALRAEFMRTQADGQTRFWILADEDQALDLASGYVPEAVKAMCLAMLDWASEDERRASRPPKKKTRRDG